MDKKGIPMNKKILVFFAIVGLVVIGRAIIQLERPGDDFQRYSGTAREYTPHIASERDSDSQSVFGMSTVAGICVCATCSGSIFENLKETDRLNSRRMRILCITFPRKPAEANMNYSKYPQNNG